MPTTNFSPMMQQYFDIKAKHQDHILFFRLGDFYEMFYDDAKLASRELEITLTGKECGQEERAPMCGVPYHSCEAYIANLIKKGYKVAVCEQLEDPKTAKGLVKRDVIRVITPGTVVENSMLDESSNNYIASVFVDGEQVGVCFCDVSTGELQATEFLGDREDQKLINEVGRFAPREILLNKAAADIERLMYFLREKLQCAVNVVDEEFFAGGEAPQVICRQFGAKSLQELGLAEKPSLSQALYSLLEYLYSTQKAGTDRITQLILYSDNQYMHLDLYARRNLELTETLRSKERRGTLLWVLDRTKTAMGKRLIRSYIENPLTNPALINKRLNAVQELYGDMMLRGDVREMLTGLFDMERIMTRIIFGNANPREMKALGSTIARLPQIKKRLEHTTSQYLQGIFREIDALEDVSSRIEAAIEDEPAITLKEGGVIKSGYDASLDELRDIVTNTKQYIARIEQKERERTGIRNLKVGFNRVFGYYIEISKSNVSAAPPEYIRKQTLTTGERFITEELKVLEEKLLGANEKIISLEQELYAQLRRFVSEQLVRIQNTANAIARLDVFACFAEVSVANRYSFPQVTLGGDITISGGRHPVVEQLLGQMPFVANDTFLDENQNQVAVITGPNMAGKSTYMRQVALIVLMAQIGCFVPAERVSMGVVDGIFTRVGASDDLASGESTFMVEMNEVASILKNATRKSLLILDEIGRGTSTFDGMSIAQAVIEYIANPKKLGAKTLFATHYHELTALEQEFSNIKNYNVAVKKRGHDITFLRRIVPGGTDDSYGIEVSKLAGIPDSIIGRAYEILQSLECVKHESQQKAAASPVPAQQQLTFEAPAHQDVLDELERVDLNVLTPLEALNLLSRLKQKLR